MKLDFSEKEFHHISESGILLLILWHKQLNVLVKLKQNVFLDENRMQKTIDMQL